MRRILRLTQDQADLFSRTLNRHEGEDACFFLFSEMITEDREIGLVREIIEIPE